MFPTKPTSRFILFTLSLLLLLSFFTTTAIVTASDLDDEIDTDFEELLALDEQEDQEQQGSQGDPSAKSEAEVLSKAQRIVLELNSDNVKRIIDGAEFVLVLGYAPWCPRSAELMPKFAEAATLLKELKSPLLMAKLDADRHTKAASMLDIKGFPTLLLFVNGTSQPYTGGFSTEEIVIWARKKTGVPVMRISSVNEAEGFLKKYHTFVLGTFDKFEGPDYVEFVKSAASDNEIQFVETSNTEVAKVLFPDIKTAKQFLGIVKSEPERYTEYEGKFEMGKILQFLDYNKFALITKLTDMNSIRVYSSPIKPQSLLVNNFYVGEGTDSTGVPTKMVTVNGSLKISVYNPATLFGIHVSSTPVNLVYSEIVVATGQLKKYYQPRKSHRTVSVNLEGNKVPLYGAGSNLSVNSQTGGEVSLTLKFKFEIKSKGEVVGKLVTTTHKKQVSCPLNIDILSTKPIKFKKSSCTYM